MNRRKVIGSAVVAAVATFVSPFLSTKATGFSVRSRHNGDVFESLGRYGKRGHHARKIRTAGSRIERPLDQLLEL